MFRFGATLELSLKGTVVVLAAVALCACHTIGSRKRERPDAYAALPSPVKSLVDHGELQKGMDTNAVYIAWGPPGAIDSQPSTTGSGSDQTWFYYADRVVLTPAWTSIPDSYGYWTLEYNPEHHSERHTKAEVYFQNDRVIGWKRY